MSVPLGRSDATTVYCGLCNWQHPIRSFEEVEHRLDQHLREAHGTHLVYAIETESGRRKDTPQSNHPI